MNKFRWCTQITALGPGLLFVIEFNAGEARVITMTAAKISYGLAVLYAIPILMYATTCAGMYIGKFALRDTHTSYILSFGASFAFTVLTYGFALAGGVFELIPGMNNAALESTNDVISLGIKYLGIVILWHVFGIAAIFIIISSCGKIFQVFRQLPQRLRARLKTRVG